MATFIGLIMNSKCQQTLKGFQQILWNTSKTIMLQNEIVMIRCYKEEYALNQLINLLV